MRLSVELTEADHLHLRARGIAVAEAERQLRLLRERPAPVILDRPSTVGDGIVRLEAVSHERLIAAAHRAAEEGRVMRFVPASGAATRMFKDLIAALAGSARPSSAPAARQFFAHLDDFAFSGELRRRSGVTSAIETEEDERTILRTLLEEMRYASLPKALIPFHRGTRVRTAFEEHLLEGAHYTRTRGGIARSHFTVAPEWREEFDLILGTIAPAIERESGSALSVTFSEQHPSTDTLAIAAEDGAPFRSDDGALLLRPAGHGALLQNLHALGADLVVIKNIDNVVPRERHAEVVYWKRVLLGYLLDVQRELAGDRPVRVCGVVRNAGEPGGAPFWVTDRSGRQSLQIVESSQVDMSDTRQRAIFESSTHFNPVDLVCAVRGPDGDPFDLHQFVDPSAVFVAKKSHEGRELIALERPGLWNGAMAGWHTVFVEVPASTFAPVKTVLDLLRPQHQSL
jgi:hypothetical protein